MDSAQPVDRLIKRLGQELDIPELGFSEERLCVVNLGDNLNVTLMSPRNADALYLSAELIPVTPVNRLVLYDRLLRMNFLLVDTDGASLAIDESSQSVFLCRVIHPFEMEEERALQVVGGFLTKCLEIQSSLLQRH